MLTRRAFAALASVSALATQAVAQTQSGPRPRRAEVEALRSFAETTHPRGHEAATDADWRARWDALAADADQLSQGAYFVRTRRALGWFEDGHTTVLPFEFVGAPPEGPFRLAMPIRARAFHDGVYVVVAKDEGLPLLGARITRIGESDAASLVRTLALQWPGSAAWVHRWAGYHFSSPALLEGLGVIGDPSRAISIEAQLGSRRVRANLRPREGAAADLRDLERPRLARENWAGSAGFGNYARVEGRAVYISCDDMADFDGRSFVDFTRECFAAMAAPNADRLIFDVRRNGGGDNFLPEALRRRILQSRFNRPGGLYVLTSPWTFSAAQNPATRLERDSFALFVGDPTGGSPNHFGDARPFQGEVSGLTSIVSTLPWFDGYPMDQRPSIFPDIPAPEMFDDFRSGRDAALEAAMTHAVSEAPDDLSEARMYYFARPSQRVEWRPFWRNV